jgi:hypothetical protein
MHVEKAANHRLGRRKRSRYLRVLAVSFLSASVVCVPVTKSNADPSACTGFVVALNPGAQTVFTHGELVCNHTMSYIYLLSNWYVYTGSLQFQTSNTQWSVGENHISYTDYFSGYPGLRLNEVCGAAVPVGPNGEHGSGFWACPGVVAWI